MKNRTFFKSLLCVVIIAISALSCDESKFKLPPQFNMRIVHAIPTAPAVDFYIDNVKFTEKPLSYNNYTNAYAVLDVTHQVDFRRVENSKPLVSKEFKLEADEFYVVFYAGTTIDPRIVLMKDDSSLPPSGKTSVNFVNLIAENTPLNIRFKGGEKLTSFASSYLSSSFFELNAGKLTFEVTNPADDSLLFTLPEFNLESGKIYTIWLKGASGGQGDNALGANIIVHNPDRVD